MWTNPLQTAPQKVQSLKIRDLPFYNLRKIGIVNLNSMEWLNSHHHGQRPFKLLSGLLGDSKVLFKSSASI